MDWKEMKEFAGIDLNDSFVLSWNYGKQNILIELEASVWPESKHYKALKCGEYTCYRKAIIEVTNAKSVEGMLKQESAEPIIDPDGSEDYGNIDSLSVINGCFNITGAFGNVSVEGGELKFFFIDDQ